MKNKKAPNQPLCVKISEAEKPQEKRLDAKLMVLLEENINRRSCAMKKHGKSE